MTTFALADAADEMDSDAYQQRLISLNKNIDQYQSIENQLHQAIQSAEAENIGEIEDFLINENGDIEKVVTNFSDMGLGDQSLHIDIATITQSDMNNAYQLAEAEFNVEEQMASILSTIETAAGSNDLSNAPDIDLISAHRLQGRNILTNDGENLGQVIDVITDQSAQKVVGVIIQNFDQGSNIALPYPTGLRIKNTGLSNDLEIQDHFANMVKTYWVAPSSN